MSPKNDEAVKSCAYRGHSHVSVSVTCVCPLNVVSVVKIKLIDDKNKKCLVVKIVGGWCRIGLMGTHVTLQGNSTNVPNLVGECPRWSECPR